MQAHLFGDLIHDMSPQICDIAFKDDLDLRIIPLQKYLIKAPKDLQDVLAPMQASYESLLKVWRCVQYRFAASDAPDEDDGKALKIVASLFTNIMHKTATGRDLEKLDASLGKSALLEVLTEVYDTVCTDITGQ